MHGLPNHETIEVMDWPARSPELNPIEHVWNSRISKRDHLPLTIQELTITFIHEWESLALQTIQNLIRCMPRKCQECCADRGGHTHN